MVGQGLGIMLFCRVLIFIFYFLKLHVKWQVDLIPGRRHICNMYVYSSTTHKFYSFQGGVSIHLRSTFER